MSAASVIVTETPGVNYTKQDGVLKETVNTEIKSSKDWRSKWSFTLDLDKYIDAAAKNYGLTYEDYKRIARIQKKKLTVNPPWDIRHVGFVPKTSNGIIGWRSANIKYSLEKTGPFYVSPKSTMKCLGLDPGPPYNCIILG